MKVKKVDMKINLFYGWFFSVATILCFASTSAMAWNPLLKENGYVKKGNSLVAKGKYQDAISAYNAAMGKLSANAGINYNKGVASYKLALNAKEAEEKGKNLKDAESFFLGAIDLSGENEIDLKAKSFYNLGNVYMEQERFAEAVETYKQALKLSPGNKDMAYNLSIAIKRLEEQKRKQEEEKKKQEEADKKQEEQKKEDSKEQKQKEEQEDKKDDQQCNQGKNEEKEQNSGKKQDQQQGDDREQKKENIAEQKQQEQMEKEKKQQQSGAEQEMPQEGDKEKNKIIPLTKQEAEAILDALKRNEKNFQLESLRNRLMGAKPRVLKDW